MAVFAAAVFCSAARADEPTSRPAKADADIPDIRLVEAFPGLTFQRPVWMTQVPGDPGRMFLVEQAGRIHVFKNERDTAESSLFLDWSDKTLSYASGGHNEEGLLCLAFDPDYARNGTFYIHYNASKPHRGVIARFQVSKDDPNRADPAGETVILDVPKPFGNHCGCCLLFGPDGYLYATFGDGGAAGDPYNNGQNLKTLLGKMLRIDVHHAGKDAPYSIPQDNPFADRKDARPEIWAYGLRNVWRMSFDRKTQDLWAGDVGQNAWEEIDLIARGGNYGWRVREGKHPFDRKAKPIEKGIEPLIEYGRRDGMSVTGGYVYRGKKHPQMQGVYFYADYVSGTVWGARFDDGKLVQNRVVLRQPSNISSFAEDADGELYILAFDRKILRVQPK